jgi:hypothetical protein
VCEKAISRSHAVEFGPADGRVNARTSHPPCHSILLCPALDALLHVTAHRIQPPAHPVDCCPFPPRDSDSDPLHSFHCRRRRRQQHHHRRRCRTPPRDYTTRTPPAPHPPPASHLRCSRKSQDRCAIPHPTDHSTARCPIHKLPPISPQAQSHPAKSSANHAPRPPPRTLAAAPPDAACLSPETEDSESTHLHALTCIRSTSLAAPDSTALPASTAAIPAALSSLDPQHPLRTLQSRWREPANHRWPIPSAELHISSTATPSRFAKGNLGVTSPTPDGLAARSPQCLAPCSLSSPDRSYIGSQS